MPCSSDAEERQVVAADVDRTAPGRRRSGRRRTSGTSGGGRRSRPGSRPRRRRTAGRCVARGRAACRRCRTRSGRRASCARSGAPRGSPTSPSVVPAEVREPLRRRRGEHDVGPAHRDRPLEALPVLRPGVHREDPGAGGDAAPGRLGDDRRAGAEAGRRGCARRSGRRRATSALRRPRASRAGCTVAP